MAFAFTLGLGTFFSPCAVALLPAYVGYFAGVGPRQTTDRGDMWRAGLRFAAAASLGILGTFVVFAGAVYAARLLFEVRSVLLARFFGYLALAVGVAVIGLGMLMLSGRGPAFVVRLQAPKQKTFTGMLAFGTLYALASLGCTLPLLLSVLFNAILLGPTGGTVLIGAYAVGFAGLMFVGTVALSVAQDASRRTLDRVMPYVRPVSGIVMIAAGAYVLYYYLHLAPPA